MMDGSGGGPPKRDEDAKGRGAVLLPRKRFRTTLPHAMTPDALSAKPRKTSWKRWALALARPGDYRRRAPSQSSNPGAGQGLVCSLHELRWQEVARLRGDEPHSRNSILSCLHHNQPAIFIR